MSFCKNRLCFCILLSALYAVYIRNQCEIKHDDLSQLSLFIRQLWKSDLEMYSMSHFVVLIYIKGLNRFRQISHSKDSALPSATMSHCQIITLENLLCLLKDFSNARVSVPRARRIQNFSLVKIFQSETFKQDYYDRTLLDTF